MTEEVLRLLMQHTPPMRSIGLYHRHRFPAEIISHCVWLYFRFLLSFRDVEEMLAMRGVVHSYETIREWCLKFGQTTCDEDLPALATSGTWMKCSSRSTDAFITYGVRLIKMTTFWIFWSKAEETRKRPGSFFASY
jgi:hypothetical protein